HLCQHVGVTAQLAGREVLDDNPPLGLRLNALGRLDGVQAQGMVRRGEGAPLQLEFGSPRMARRKAHEGCSDSGGEQGATLDLHGLAPARWWGTSASRDAR